MAIVEKLTYDELILFEVLRNPVLCTEFIYNIDLVPGVDTPFEFSWYQREMMCDFNDHVSICTARATGKCLDESSKILNPNTGEYRTVKEWFFSGGLNSILAIDDNWKNRVSTCTIEPNGTKDCIDIRSTGGYKTVVTDEHPILTNIGFKPANKLKIGDYIACGKGIPFFGNDISLPDTHIKMLAHFIAEGTYHCGSITTTDEVVIQDINEFAESIGYKVRRDNITYFISSGKYGVGNVYLDMLTKYGLREKHSYDKFIPQVIFRLPKDKLGMFLNRLFSDDGWCMDSSGHCHVGYSSASETLIRDIRHLLLRFGIRSSIVFKKNKCLGSWNLSITGFEHLSKFRNEIGFCIDYKTKKLESATHKSLNYPNQADVLPIPNYKDYAVTRADENYTRKLNYYPTRVKASRVENKDVDFRKYEDADIFWSKITSLTKVPNRETYAVEVNNQNTHLVDDIWSHNTVSLSSLIFWVLVYKVFPDDYILYSVPSKVHLEPVFTNLIRLFRSNSFLKNFIDRSTGINSSDFKITLLNHSVLLCRIAGQSGTGANLIGLHTPMILADECGYFPMQAFQEMQPSLNVWTPGYREIVAGVPTGLREGNVLYHADQENSNYTKHRVSAFDNPRFNNEQVQKAKDQYGGEDTDDFIHYVLGLHGKPVFSIFDRNLFRIEPYPVIKLDINGLSGEGFDEISAKISAFPTITAKNFGIILGIDLGYTEPTAITINYIDHNDKIKFHGRIKLTKVSYPVQEKLIDLLDTKFDPMIIGMDEGSAGKSVRQHLVEDIEYAHKNYKDRLTVIDFSTSLIIGITADGEEIKSKTKPYTVSVLQEYTNNHKLVFSSTDLEMVSELEKMTYSKSVNGDISYKTLTDRGGKRGEDHFTSALLCGIGAYHMTLGTVKKRERVVLFRSGWVY